MTNGTSVVVVGHHGGGHYGAASHHHSPQQPNHSNDNTHHHQNEGVPLLPVYVVPSDQTGSCCSKNFYSFIMEQMYYTLQFRCTIMVNYRDEGCYHHPHQYSETIPILPTHHRVYLLHSAGNSLKGEKFECNSKFVFAVVIMILGCIAIFFAYLYIFSKKHH